MSLSAAKLRTPDLTGCALDGRYELHAVIGEGTFGRVYRGRDRRLARMVAIKVIKPWWGEDPDWVARFEREAQLMASVSSSGIVQIYDVGDAAEGLYYVAELVHGESLTERLRRAPLAPPQARDFAAQLSRALASAHARRVVHGDVKPANVLISNTGQVKVTDFGLARLLGGSSAAVMGTVVGTPSYMAPEQARGTGTTPSSDVYSIGVVLYEMLAGSPPFRGGSPVELALRHIEETPPPLPSTTPRDLKAITERALAKSPRERYRDARELAEALAADVKSPRTGKRATSRRRPEAPAATLVAPWTSPRRNVNPAARRRTAAVFSLVLLVLAAMIAGAILTGGAQRVSVPNLRGLTRTQITTALARAHLRIAFRSGYSHAPNGTAFSQQPKPGARIAKGARVTAAISQGPPPVTVPRLVGFSLPDARSSLQQLGLSTTVTEAPIPGVSTGTVTAQTPRAGGKLKPGATVALTVAQAPRWRGLVTFSDRQLQTAPFRIRGTHWRIVYRMAYSGTCTFIFVCMGPTARVTDLAAGTTVAKFDLSDGGEHARTIDAGAGTYQIEVTPGDDSSRWSAEVEDYY